MGNLHNSYPTTNSGAEQLLAGFAAVQSIAAELHEMKELKFLLSQLIKMKANASDEDADGWLDAKRAAKYMGISSGSFDKYRYLTNPRIKGYNLDGKTLYKKSDLDDFVKLYEIKSKGLA